MHIYFVCGLVVYIIATVLTAIGLFVREEEFTKLKQAEIGIRVFMLAFLLWPLFLIMLFIEIKSRL